MSVVFLLTLPACAFQPRSLTGFFVTLVCSVCEQWLTEPDAKPTLHNVNMQLRKGALTAVVCLPFRLVSVRLLPLL